MSHNKCTCEISGYVVYNLCKLDCVVVFVCQVRLRAMRSLHQFPPGDLLSNENWPELKQSLQKTLKDPNASLSVCFSCIITTVHNYPSL